MDVVISAGARELRDGMVAVVGLGIPQLAAALAQHTHAPRLHVLNEIGVVDAKLIELGSLNPRHKNRILPMQDVSFVSRIVWSSQ